MRTQKVGAQRRGGDSGAPKDAVVEQQKPSNNRSTDLTQLPRVESLSLLIEDAVMALANARSAAEVLDARDRANVVYAAAKMAARLAKAKDAHDTVIAACRKAQADALVIEAQAQCRLADEYDAAQERGEAKRAGKPKNNIIPNENNIAAVDDIGLTSKQVHEARIVRDAEKENPGIVRKTVDERLSADQEPTRADVKRATNPKPPPPTYLCPVIEDMITQSGLDPNSGKQPASKPKIEGTKPQSPVLQSNSVEHYTPARYIEAARKVLEIIDLDPASCEEANKTVKALKFHDKESDGLKHEWRGRVWLNPPYNGSAAPFVEKLMDSLANKKVTAAIVCLNSNSADSKWFRPLWKGLLCFCYDRINFGNNGSGGGNTHGTVFIYFGPRRDAFAEMFKQFGAVVSEYQPEVAS
jgi:hypothetical protein